MENKLKIVKLLTRLENTIYDILNNQIKGNTEAVDKAFLENEAVRLEILEIIKD